MEKYKIEKNVPIPDSQKRYPLAEMEIGDSFLVPIVDNKYMATRNRLNPAFSKFKKSDSPRKYLTKRTDDGNDIRVWRVE